MNDPHHDNRQRGDELAETPPPPYPREWTYEQRVTGYWAAISRGFPRHTSGWYGLLSQAENKHEHIAGVLAQEAMDYDQ